MEIFVSASESADAATLTVVLFLVLVVEKIALEASVISKFNTAFFAVFLNRLTSVADHTKQFLDFLSFDIVVLGIVVAEAAGVSFIATRGLQENNNLIN